MTDQSPTAKTAGVLVLFGYMAVFGALAFAVDGAWYAYRDSVESRRWPAVVATVSGCRIHTSYDSVHGSARAAHTVDCLFRYDVDGEPYAVKAQAGNVVSIVRGQIDLTRRPVTLGALQTWVRRHPEGASVTIHHDPADAHRISLVGVDDDIRWQTSGGYLQGALVFGAFGLALLCAGRALKNRRARAEVHGGLERRAS